LLSIVGSLTVLVFLVQTVIAMFARGTSWFEFWSWAAAAETAAWRLKWISIPVLFVTLWFGRKIYRSIRLQPERFCGVTYARSGLVASATVALLIALLIGITVPARLRQRQMAKEAAVRAYWHTFEAAVFQYRLRYQTYPADFKELRDRVSDPYGTLAETLNHLDPNGYRPYGDVAVVGVEKSRSLRGAAIRNAAVSIAGDDTPTGGLVFTKFELRMPGEDKILGNDDDWIARDGMLVRWSDIAKGGVGRSVSAGALQP
jgi:type II secretory pathway pseudopilin PulG